MTRRRPLTPAKIAAMHRVYLQVRSTIIVARIFRVPHASTVWRAFQREGLPVDPRLPTAPSITWNGGTYSLRVTGYYAHTMDRSRYLHRDVWEHHHGPIPPGLEVHHIDHDKANNAVENLELLSKSEHARLHHLERAS